MKTVLDTNILISALIRDSATRRFIVETNESLAYPESGIREIQKHKEFILEKSGLSEEEFESVFDILLDYIELIPDDVLEKTIEEAKEIMLEIDEKDVIFLATALALGDAVIWSDDKDFKRQSRVPVKTSKEFFKDKFTD